MKSSFLIPIMITMALLCVVSCRPTKKNSVREGVYMTVEVSEPLLSRRMSDTVRLGRVRGGEMVNIEFDVRNTGDKPFVISNFVTSCGCTLFGFSREPIAPGDSRRVEMSFDSRGLYGDVFKTAMMQTSLGPIPYNIVVEAQVK